VFNYKALESQSGVEGWMICDIKFYLFEGYPSPDISLMGRGKNEKKGLPPVFNSLPRRGETNKGNLSRDDESVREERGNPS
jgi:hypothetical protein